MPVTPCDFFNQPGYHPHTRTAGAMGVFTPGRFDKGRAGDVNVCPAITMVLIDESLEDAGLPGRSDIADADILSNDERILWEGRPFLSILTHYQITTERVRIIHGLLGRSRDDIELVRIQDIDLQQSMTERALGVGDILISSADPTLPETRLNNVKHPEEVHEILRRAMLNARKRFRYSVQEEM